MSEEQAPKVQDTESTEWIKSLTGTESILVFSPDGKVRYVKPDLKWMAQANPQELASVLFPLGLMMRMRGDPEWQVDMGRYIFEKSQALIEEEGQNAN